MSRPAIRPSQPEPAPPRSSARARHLEVVSPPRRDLAWIRRTGTIVILSLFLGLFATGAVQGVVTQAQGRIDQLNTQITEAVETERQLGLRRGELLSPERLRREAADRLGMVRSETVVFLLPSETPTR